MGMWGVCPLGVLLQQNLILGAMKSTSQYPAKRFLAVRITPLFPHSCFHLYHRGFFVEQKCWERENWFIVQLKKLFYVISLYFNDDH